MNIIIFPPSRLRLTYINPRKWYRGGLIAATALTLSALLGCGYLLGLYFGNEVILSQWEERHHGVRSQAARSQSKNSSAQVDALTTQAGILASPGSAN